METSTSTTPIAALVHQGRPRARVPTAVTPAVPRSKEPVKPSQLFGPDPRRHRMLSEQHPGDIAADVVADRSEDGQQHQHLRLLAEQQQQESSPGTGSRPGRTRPLATSRSALSPMGLATRHRMSTQTAAAVATSSPSAPNTTVETTIPITPTNNGICGSCRPPWARARVTSSTATTIAMAASTAKACGTTNSATNSTAARPAPTAIPRRADYGPHRRAGVGIGRGLRRAASTSRGRPSACGHRGRRSR